jgi:hypothetical protein
MGVLGKAETKEDFDRMKGVIEKRFPGHRIELESESKAQKQARLDTVRQRSFEKRKATGNDEKVLKEATAEQKAKKAEVVQRSARQNVAPPKEHVRTPGTPV